VTSEGRETCKQARDRVTATVYTCQDPKRQSSTWRGSIPRASSGADSGRRLCQAPVGAVRRGWGDGPSGHACEIRGLAEDVLDDRFTELENDRGGHTQQGHSGSTKPGPEFSRFEVTSPEGLRTKRPSSILDRAGTVNRTMASPVRPTCHRQLPRPP
jgi:hypothetical protein